MDWIEFAARYGIPVAILGAIGWFFVTQIWPFITAAWAQQQEERRAERREFFQELATARNEFRAIMDAERKTRIEERNLFLAALDRHRDQLAAIAQSLEDSNGAAKESK